MPEDTFNPPKPRIYIDGKPQAQYEAEQSGGLSVTRSLSDDLCKRIVAPGRTVEWRGRRYTGGETVYLTPETANYNIRRGNAVHPADYQPQHGKPVTVRESR